MGVNVAWWVRLITGWDVPERDSVAGKNCATPACMHPGDASCIVVAAQRSSKFRTDYGPQDHVQHIYSPQRLKVWINNSLLPGTVAC